MPKTAAPKTPSNVGANIRTAREAKKLTQLALGHALGWIGADAGAQISRFENGLIDPRLSTLQRIAEALGVKLENLLKQPKN